MVLQPIAQPNPDLSTQRPKARTLMIGDKRQLENEIKSPRPTKRIRLEEWLSDMGSESEVDSVESAQRSNTSSPQEPPISVSSTTTLQRHPSPPVDRIGLLPPTKARKPTDSQRKLPKPLPQNELQVPLSNQVRSFTGLGVSKQIVSAMAAMSIRRPTEVQAACIPPLIAGKDCIGNAKTGSGKTVAFAVPIIQKLSQDPYGIFALVLTPTRELAFQIADQFAVLGGPLNVRTAVIVGGMDMMAQAIELERRPHVVVATPGRMVDHLRSTSGDWSLSRVQFLVLDEADRLLTPTFSSDLAELFRALPEQRQTSLFTATITNSIDAIADAPPKPGKERPFIHRMTTTIETVEALKQFYLLVPSHIREAYLYYLLLNPPDEIVHMRRAAPERKPKASKGKAKTKTKSKTNNTAIVDEDEIVQPPPTIIFCTRPKAVAYLTHFLKALDIRATALHSRLTQRERLNSLDLFRASVIPVLVSTDVGARGLDIEGVALVVNWDMPTEPEEYTHRVGRTARMGRSGMAVSFVTERDEERVQKVEARIGTQLIEMSLPESRVLEPLNKVFTAQRVARLNLQDSDFGKREEIRKTKEARRNAKQRIVDGY